jgi:HEAT repeat protein
MNRFFFPLRMVVGLLITLPLAGITGRLIAAEPAADSTPVEQVTAKPRRNGGGGLGTSSYRPSDQEQPFFAKLAAEEKETGGLAGNYDISKKDGVYVGWFGIVREIAEDKTGGKTTLLVEHKYFDGLTDSHIQALSSFNGSGDFRAVLRGTGHVIRPLNLVKVYGKVSKGADDVLQVDAVFVRNWHWGTFTFLAAHGKQRGSEQWRKLNKVELPAIYDPYPDDEYYQARLGTRPPDEKNRNIFHQLALEAAKGAGLPAASVPAPRDDAQPPKSVTPRVDIATFRARALQAAKKVRPDAEKVVQPLIDALAKEKSTDEALEAATKAEAEGAAVAVLAEALQVEKEDVRISAAKLLGEMGFVSRTVVPVLIAALQDENEYVRSDAATVLGDIGPEAQAAVPALLVALVDPSDSVRSHASEALGKVKVQAKYVVPGLIAALQDDDDHVRFMTVEALGEFGPEAASAAQPLREALLRDTDGNVRWNAAGSLAAVDPEGKIALPALLEAMKARDGNVRRFAASALGRFGPKAKEAAPLLLAGLKDSNTGARIAAAGAMWQVDRNAKDTVPVLIQVLENDPAIPHLWAAQTIAAIGPEAKAAVPALRKLLATSSWPYGTIQALGNIGPDAVAAVPDLLERLESEDGDVRAYAAGALWKINQHPRAIPSLLEELKNPRYGNPFYAIITAGEIGPPAKAGVPELVKALSHRELYVRQVALRALEKVDPSAIPGLPERAPFPGK